MRQWAKERRGTRDTRKESGSTQPKFYFCEKSLNNKLSCIEIIYILPADNLSYQLHINPKLFAYNFNDRNVFCMAKQKRRAR